MAKPVILVNFKSYKETTGEKAVELAKICEKVAKEKDENIIIAVADTDIYRVAQNVSIPIFAQHVDEFAPGKHTGFISPEAIKAAGASGTLINHSEHRLRLDQIDHAVERAKKVRLITVVCATEPDAGQAVAAFEPYFVAIEPPELIGGKVSVSSAKPEVITESVKRIHSVNPNVKVLVGAGVHRGKDVKKALQLGAAGVLLASGVDLAQDPERVLLDLIDYK